MEKEGYKKLEEYILRYRDFLSQQGKKKASVQYYACPPGQLIKFLKKKFILYPHEITWENVEEFQRALYSERGFGFDTVRIYIYRIREFMKYVRDNGIEVECNFNILPKPKPKDERLKRYYTFEDLLKRYLMVQRRWISFAYSNQIDKNLRMFFKYLRTQGIKNVYSVTEGIILKYRDYLWSEFKEGRLGALVCEGQVERLRFIYKFFNFLYRERIIDKIPSFNIDWKAYFKKIREEAKTIPKPPKYKDWVPPHLKELMQKFLDYQKAKGRTERTCSRYHQDIRIFFDYLETKGITSIDQVTKRIMLDYYTYLVNYKGTRGEGICDLTRAHLLLSIRIFFSFLVRFDFIPTDPAEYLEPMKEEKGLPKDYMDEKEMIRVLASPNVNEPLGLRDKAMLEVMFSTGIRKSELCHFDMTDVDYHQGLVRVNFPKGGKSFQRVIPIGDIALEYIKLYIEKARPKLENGIETKALFLSYTGKRICKEVPLAVAKKYSFE